MPKRLEGKVAVVTGGSRGIGRAIVIDLALKGAEVFFTFKENEEKATALIRALAAEAVGRGHVAPPRVADRPLDIGVEHQGVVVFVGEALGRAPAGAFEQPEVRGSEVDVSDAGPSEQIGPLLAVAIAQDLHLGSACSVGDHRFCRQFACHSLPPISPVDHSQ